MKARLALVLGIAVSWSGQASAVETVLLWDDFEGYADQAAFEAAWPRAMGGQTFGTPAYPAILLDTGTWTTEQGLPAGTGHSVKLIAPLLVVSPPVAHPHEDVQRNERIIEETGEAAAANVIRFSFDFYDTDAAAQPYRQFAQIVDGTAATSTGGVIQMGLNNNLASSAQGGNFYMARLLGITSGNPFFKLNDGGAATLRTTGWHNLAVEISDTDYKFYVDDILAKTIANTITLRSFDIVRLGAGASSLHDAYYDNVEVVLNPEPEIGDFNGDGFVNDDDFNDPTVGFKARFGADLTGKDFLTWQRNYGHPGAVAAGVPEPASAALAGLVLAGLAAVRRRLSAVRGET